MKKSDKKIEKQIVNLLTNVCEQHKQQTPGFLWLTHQVNYKNLNATLKIWCVYATNQDIQTTNKNTLVKDIIDTLGELNIRLNNPNEAIIFDSEENCENSHQGNWQRRLQQCYH